MHPDVISDTPGDCLICGMELEIVGPAAAEADGHALAETRQLARKIWIGLALTVPIFILAMGLMIPGLANALRLGRMKLGLNSLGPAPSVSP